MLTPEELAKMRQQLMDPQLSPEELESAERWRVGELLATIELLQADLEMARGGSGPSH